MYSRGLETLFVKNQILILEEKVTSKKNQLTH